ncbi:SsrA-binding protein SmpB [Candidatus Gracilibacteria bacterium]|nr:SsrA-binding protein SmpB [Candidatus Gracilibacteria bacterium]
MKKKKNEGEITKNKKAFFDYEIIKSYEGGVELTGYETKSIRHGGANLKGSFIIINGNALYIKNMHISAWKALPKSMSIDTVKEIKVFLHKKDIVYLEGKSREKGYSIIPLSLYFKGSLIKIQVGLVRGKKQFEKKQVLKDRSMKKEADKAASKYL